MSVGRQAAWATCWRLLFSDTMEDREQDSGVIRALQFAAREGTRGVRVGESRVEYQAQANLVRDIFGNPFQPVAADLAWLTSTVVSLATAIYDDRAFDRLPILADAREDAGCTQEEVLNHCRQPGVHVRGCWVLDLVLGKK